jgi:hypothetical protein
MGERCYSAKHEVDALFACLYHMRTHSVYNAQRFPRVVVLQFYCSCRLCVHKLKSKKDRFYYHSKIPWSAGFFEGCVGARY